MNTFDSYAHERSEILELINRYAWGYDSKDLELLGSVFSINASTSGVIMGSEQSWGPWTGRSEIVNNLSAIRESQTDQRRHQISTPIFTSFTNELAEVRCYLALYAVASPKPPKLVATGTYTARVSKKEGQWLIDALDAQLDSEF